MLKKYLNRRSERNYETKQLDASFISELTQVINSSPTSINGNTFSAIMVQDQKVKDFMSENNWNQPHIKQASLVVVFCADLNRVDTQLKLNDSKFENLSQNYKQEAYDAALGDAFISCSYASSYALSQNLGSCFIGGVRTYAPQLQEILNLKENIVPVVALTIGHIKEQEEVKPKLNKVFVEKYDEETEALNVSNYDAVMTKYYAKRSTNNKKQMSWSKASTRAYLSMNTQYDKYIELKNKILKK